MNEHNAFARRLFAGLPGRYDLLEETLSFGQNGRWRRTMVDRVVEVAPGRIVDVATGTAGVALQLADRTDAQIIGLDITLAMLRQGQEVVARRGGEDRIRLVLARAEQLPFPDASFDALTFTYLLRYVDDPAATLRELARVVRPGGRIAAVEFHRPPRHPWREAWWLYTRLGLPVLGGLAGRAWYEVGRFLGPNISEFYDRYPLAAQLADWERAGLIDVDHRIMSLGGGVVIWGSRIRG